VNYFQYSSVTGNGPTRGTVSVYNQFGLMGMLSNPMLSNALGTTQGDPPPPGVNLSVNYAQMSLPNQQMINTAGLYGLPAYGAYPGLYGSLGYGYPGLGAPGYGYPGLNPLGYGGLPGVPPASKGIFGNGGNGL
jgi:hypothetical protein